MKIIKLSAIDSTNSYLLELNKQMSLEDEITVVAQTQTKGKGQFGAQWYSKDQESLTFSVFKRFEALSVERQSEIAYAVALGLKNGLVGLKVPRITIKWPNDILSESKKLAGILIENQVKGGKVTASVIGIGLNVNNMAFKELPQATSMAIASGRTFDLEAVLNQVVRAILEQIRDLTCKDSEALKKQYEASLFKKDQISVFENPEGQRFNGKIIGVTNKGELCLALEDDTFRTYWLKEIKMLY